MDRPHQKSFSPKTLVLVPTDLERQRLASPGAPAMELAGFGPIAAAARTAALLATGAYARVILLGIAGTLDPLAFPVGQAKSFGTLALWGLGAGVGDGHVGLLGLGFAQWPGDAHTAPVRDRLSAQSGSATLVTVCSASATPSDAARIEHAVPGATAEDMEAFGVALACHLAKVPFHCLRGASNLAGDRNHAHWRIEEALSAVSELAASTFPEVWERP